AERGGRLALAAVLALGLGLGAMLIWQSLPGGMAATVDAVDGTLFQVGETAHIPIATGTEIREDERVRSGRDGGAVLALTDGSRVELRPRTELSIDRGLRGTTIRLARGSVIVQAADQRQGKLYVATDDCLVSVTGTIFSVNHGTKGSRVSVIEGEVRVDQNGRETVLHPGDQITTSANLGLLPLGDEIAWSRNADRYLELIGELAVLRQELLDRVPRPDLRYHSRLLDLMPEGTVFFAAVPNLSQTLTESYQIALERLDESPELRAWWEAHDGPSTIQPVLDDVVARLSEVGGYVGQELAVGAFQRGDDSGAPLVLAEIVNAAALRAFIEEQIDTYTDGDVPLAFLDDPLAPAAGGERLWIWLHDDLLAASPDLEAVRGVARLVLEEESNPFAGSDFHQQIASLYNEGVSILVAVDLGEVVSYATGQTSDEDRRAMTLAGADNLRYLMLEQKHLDEITEHRAVLSFRSPRHGIASWLAEPAPMGALDMVSPDAKMLAAFVVKDPAAMLDELNAMFSDDERAEFDRELAAIEEELGLSLRDDLAATIGGEVAFAIDGPMLPSPSWKLIVEIYDPARFQWAIEQAIVRANLKLAQLGEEEIELQQEVVGGRTFYTLPARLTEIHYTFVEGYLVAAPSRGLLDRAIRYRESGYTIVDSPRFRALLPADPRENFSAVLYQDLASLLQGVVERFGEDRLTEEQKEAIGNAGPTLVYAYGESDRIIVAATSDGDLIGGSLLGLLGLQLPGDLDEVLHEVTGGS
ncbi:MAG: hypothetical protein D6696_21500, partial [Acidobacteria bacterium]